MNSCSSVSFYFGWKLKSLFDIFPDMIADSHFLYGTLLFSYDRLLKFAIHFSDIYLLYPILFIRSLSLVTEDCKWYPVNHKSTETFSGVNFLPSSAFEDLWWVLRFVCYILEDIIKRVALLPFLPVDIWWILKWEMSRCPGLMAAFAALMLAQKIPRSIVVFFSMLSWLLISNLIALS